MENNKSFEKLVGTTLDGRYKIERLLGTGGMSVVFRARDERENRMVAIKMLRDEIAEDEESLHRFVNESRAVAMLSHPNIVGIYDVSVETNVKYLVMEYVEGISLRDYMNKRGALTFDEVVSYSEQILAALEHAHSKGIVHRDIKPQNIMLLKDGIVKVTDFGIAKLPDSETITISDKAIGTVYYISPEQAAGKRSDARADLYSFGVMMYEMAAGRLPFDDESSISVVLMQMHDKPVPPRQINAKIPRGLEQLILFSMEKEPKNRYQSAKDMLRELRRIKRKPSASVMSPSKIASERRSEKNLKQNPPSRSMTPIVLGVAFSLLFVGLVSLFYVLDSLNIGGMGTASIDVPQAVGKIYTNADEMGFEKGYFVLNVDYDYSTAVPKGEVISQMPVAGSSRKVPCRVSIVVSLGPQMITLEDYTIMDWRLAQSKLRQLNFVVQTVEKVNEAVPSGYVISTDPAPGTAVVAGSTVTIYISRGAAQESVSVPNFLGMTEKNVKTILDEYRLTVGKVTYTRSKKAAGTVLAQTPDQGTTVFSGISEIGFVVSGGPDYDTNFYPDVTGLASEAALTQLQTYGMNVKLVRVKSDMAAGTVLTQLPAPGADLPRDTVDVTLSISGGPDYEPIIRKFYSPDLRGYTLTNATALLKHLGAAVGKLRYIVDDKPAGTVLEQTVPANSLVSGYDGEIYFGLTVSGGPDYIPPEVTITMPEIYGLTLEEAREALESIGIRIGKVNYAASNDPVGFVIDQSVGEGEDVIGPEWQIFVDITLSGGPDYTEPVTEPVTEPGTEPVTGPATGPATEPATEPVTEPVTGPVTEPVTEPETAAP